MLDPPVTREQLEDPAHIGGKTAASTDVQVGARGGEEVLLSSSTCRTLSAWRKLSRDGALPQTFRANFMGKHSCALMGGHTWADTWADTHGRTFMRKHSGPSADLTSGSHAAIWVQDRGGETGLNAYMQLPVEQYWTLNPGMIRQLGGNCFALQVPRISVRLRLCACASIPYQPRRVPPMCPVPCAAEAQNPRASSGGGLHHGSETSTTARLAACSCSTCGSSHWCTCRCAWSKTTRRCWCGRRTGASAAASSSRSSTSTGASAWPSPRACPGRPRRLPAAAGRLATALRHQQRAQVWCLGFDNHIVMPWGSTRYWSCKGFTAILAHTRDCTQGWLSRNSPYSTQLLQQCSLSMCAGTVHGSLDLDVWSEVIGPFRFLPRSVLEGTGNAVLGTLMSSLLPPFLKRWGLSELEKGGQVADRACLSLQMPAASEPLSSALCP